MITVNFGTTEFATACTIFAPSFAMPAALVLAADHEAGDVLQEDQRDAAQVAQLDEMRRLERRLGEQHAVVGDDADEEAVQPREAGDERRRVALLELVEPRAVDEARDDLAHVVRLADVGVDDAVDLGRIVARLFGRGRCPAAGASSCSASRRSSGTISSACSSSSAK